VTARTPRVPSYRLHKPSGQAVVTLDGRDIYLGRYGSRQSRAEYDRLVAEWLAQGRRRPAPEPEAGPDPTVNEMLLAYLRHADAYYVKNGKPTRETINIRLALRPLRQLYGHTPARDFGPLALKAVRQAMIDSGLCRTEVNKRVRNVVRAFKWAVAEEMVPPSVHHGIRAVPGLRRGRADVRETEPVGPVPEAMVDAIRPHVARQVWAMVELQRLTGMRPGEVILMRTGDLDMTGAVWSYAPPRHKTEHHRHRRVVYLGPRAQAVLKPWLRADRTAYLFQPGEALEEHWQERRRHRKTPMTPSQEARRRKRRRSRPIGPHYTTTSYGHAIAKACDRSSPHPALSQIRKQDLTAEQAAELKEWQRQHRWHAHQLRHNAATRLRKEFGLDTARAVLGHATTATTEVYAELDQAKAAEAMKRIG
jgi:integrase